MNRILFFLGLSFFVLHSCKQEIKQLREDKNINSNVLDSTQMAMIRKKIMQVENNAAHFIHGVDTSKLPSIDSASLGKHLQLDQKKSDSLPQTQSQKKANLSHHHHVHHHKR